MTELIPKDQYSFKLHKNPYQTFDEILECLALYLFLKNKYQIQVWLSIPEKYANNESFITKYEKYVNNHIQKFFNSQTSNQSGNRVIILSSKQAFGDMIELNIYY